MFKKLFSGFRGKNTITNKSRTNSINWREAFENSEQASVSKKISQGLAAELNANENGNRILNIIYRYGNNVEWSDEINEKLSLLGYSALTSGMRSEDLIKGIMEKHPDLDEKELLAYIRTKCGIASTALKQIRAENYGRPWYIWYTCRDERVRPEHRLMHNMVCRWDDPPNPQNLYDKSTGSNIHPRYILGCRCDALTVVSEKDIKLPARVYIGGKIHTATTVKGLQRMMK